MFLKVRHVQRMNGGGGVVFATGTPIANSVAEMFTMQRYLQMTALRRLNLQHFDSWAATFGEPVTAMELAPDGSGYRLQHALRPVHQRAGTDADVPPGRRHADRGDAQAAAARTGDGGKAITSSAPAPRAEEVRGIARRAGGEDCKRLQC